MWGKAFGRLSGLIMLSIALYVPSEARAQSATLTISGQPVTTAVVNTRYVFAPTVSGGRGTRRSFKVRGKPSWASFSGRTGTLSGTPASSQVGDYANIQISVTDGRTTAYLPAFSLKVTTGTSTTNRAPSVSGSPPTSVAAGSAYAFQPSASDPDGDALSFTIQGKPAWAAFSPASGRLSGTPASTNVGTFAGISIMASDGKTVSSLPAFSIQVLAPTATNTAPTISGSPATSVLVGQPYVFQPVGTDADGDTIAYGISNKPVWATFSAATGRLSGMPTSADAGTHSNIVIAVSDSKANATLPPFGVVVVQVSNGSATVNWAAPTTNTDGSPLTDLAGYRIQYGTSPATLTQTIVVSNPGLTSYVVENLVPGTWYFSLTAFNATGSASTPTGTASKTIP